MARTYNALLLIMPVGKKKKREGDNKEIKRLNTLVFIEKNNTIWKKKFYFELARKNKWKLPAYGFEKKSNVGMETRLEVHKNILSLISRSFFKKEGFFVSSYAAALPDNENKNHHHKTLCLPRFCFPRNANGNRRKPTVREKGRG